ncbi:MAG: ArsI/CadI family heavy metal resistance metalloenzyme [Gammaproteobacteria bacterium]
MPVTTTQSESQSCCSPSQPAATTSQSCCAPPVSAETKDLLSAVDFPGDQRIHISLNVKNVKRSLPFYQVLFNQNPTKLRADYAKWETHEPAVNFTINEHPDAVDRDGHFGIEVKDTQAITDAVQRFIAAGFKVATTETQVACCYSVQDKAWVVDPDANHWEFFVVTQNEAEEGCGLTCICYDPDTGGCNWKGRSDQATVAAAS